MHRTNGIASIPPQVHTGRMGKLSRWSAIALAAALLPVVAARAYTESQAAERQKIEQFNHELDDAILHMDNARILALWADDGVTLLPGMAPVEGKINVAAFMQRAIASMPGFHVTEQHTDFRNIEISGDWASEWGLAHQVATPPGGKAPIEVHGKILLVLHRDSAGAWKIKQEMWNDDAKQ
jgi:ketosteroid isomerase-like protein